MGDGVADDTAAIQAAINYRASRLRFPKAPHIHQYHYQSILREFIGSGSANTGTYLKRKTGATGLGLRGTVQPCISGSHRSFPNGRQQQVAETYGIDLSGFSFVPFKTCGFVLSDGWGLCGRIHYPVNKQFSNNTF